jgi:DNA-directed RNA polymerase subunit RPC12/RpoP
MIKKVIRKSRPLRMGNPMFRILCISCGVKIRENASEDSHGVCLRCFYRMLAARLRAHKRVAEGEFVSER